MREAIKKNWKGMLLAAIIILLPMVVGVVLWDRLPDPMATHWDFAGNANGWTSRAFTVFGIPLVMLALHMVCLLVTESDRNSCGQNPKLKRIMYGVVPVVSLLLCVTIYPSALGMKLPMQTMALLFLGVMLLIVGNYMPKCTMNRWMGIRVPWTYTSEANWTATHRFAGRVYVVIGLVCLCCAFIPLGRFGAALVVMIIAGCLSPVVYSYLYEKRNG